jgi:hypothetical protein
MAPHTKSQITSIVVSGLLLAACGSASAQKPPKNQLQLETTACKLISPTEEPTLTSAGFEVIYVPTSTLLALKRTDDRSFRDVVRAYDVAANDQNTIAMIRALNNGVRVCHSLGLKTAT